jgi:hypothetical protein
MKLLKEMNCELFVSTVNRAIFFEPLMPWQEGKGG